MIFPARSDGRTQPTYDSFVLHNEQRAALATIAAADDDGMYVSNKYAREGGTTRCLFTFVSHYFVLLFRQRSFTRGHPTSLSLELRAPNLTRVHEG